MSNGFANFVLEAEQRFGVPATWILAVMRAESGGDPAVRSPKGAMGLMQIMPSTWSDLRSRYALGANPFDPHDNILAGAGYLRELYDRFGRSGFLAAYNAGPKRYLDHLATGLPLPPETQSYVAAVVPRLQSEGVLAAGLGPTPARSWTVAPLFLDAVPSETADSKSRPPAISTSTNGDAQPAIRSPLTPQSEGLFVSLNSTEPRP